MSINYKDAGVDIVKGEQLVEKIKKKVKSTYGNRVHAGVGGFACLYEMNDRYLAAGTDGVGTKLMIARQLGIHHSIGIDLVAMCVNDILCTGAKPLFFMDYLACGELDLEVSEQIIDGVVKGCLDSDCALIGGETAEMPGMYAPGDYDLAGFAVGEVFKDQLIDGSKIKSNHAIIGLPSSGFHSNGYSLIRKLVAKDETELLNECLTPTKIYWKALVNILDLCSGMAHITGGGFSNIARLNKEIDYHITNLDFLDKRPAFMKTICDRSNLSHNELFDTFNMGVGLVIITDQKELLCERLSEAGEDFYYLGETAAGNGKVVIDY